MDSVLARLEAVTARLESYERNVQVRAGCHRSVFVHEKHFAATALILKLLLVTLNFSPQSNLQITPGTSSSRTVAGAATPPTSTSQKPAAAPGPKPVIISVDPPKTVTVEDWDAFLNQEVAVLVRASEILPEEFQGSTKLLAR
jgi:Adenylate cyclase associated (CAP) N terminal